MKRLCLLGLAAMLVAHSATAQILLQDNFNTENGGNSSLNYAGFANWTAIGQVDLVKSGDFGISCAGGVGACVDLDGTSGPGTLRSVQNFAFSAGDLMRITFDISGSQRVGSADQFQLGFNFGGNLQLSSYLGLGGFSAVTSGPTTLSAFAAAVSINGAAPFVSWGFQFTAAQAGNVRYELGTSSADNIGPILDNILVERVTSRSVVPEPSTWAMLGLGLSALGVAARRRRS